MVSNPIAMASNLPARFSLVIAGVHFAEVIICNVSPAKINAEETLSSLRFAERAKKIENKVWLVSRVLLMRYFFPKRYFYSVSSIL